MAELEGRWVRRKVERSKEIGRDREGGIEIGWIMTGKKTRK